MNIQTSISKRISGLCLIFVFLVGVMAWTQPSTSMAQINLGGGKEKDKKKEEDKPQFPHHRFKGTILTVKLEERRFLLDTPDGLAILVQVDDKTKIKRRKEKKGEGDVLFADLKKGDAVEVSGQLPPTRILQAEKIFVEPEAKK